MPPVIIIIIIITPTSTGLNLQRYSYNRNIDRLPSVKRNSEIKCDLLFLLWQHGPGTMLLLEVQEQLHRVLVPVPDIKTSEEVL